MIASIPMGGEETPLVRVLIEPGVYNAVVTDCTFEEYEGKNGKPGGYMIKTKAQIKSGDNGQEDIPAKDKTATFNTFTNRAADVKKLWVCAGNPREVTDFDPEAMKGKSLRVRISHRGYTDRDGQQAMSEDVFPLLDPETERQEKIKYGLIKS